MKKIVKIKQKQSRQENEAEKWSKLAPVIGRAISGCREIDDVTAFPRRPKTKLTP